MPSKVATVEHVVKGEATLTPAPRKAETGGTISIQFHPFPGHGEVYVYVERMATIGAGVVHREHASKAGPSLRKRRALFRLRPPFTGPDFNLGDHLAPPLDPPPLPMRIEVGRSGRKPKVFTTDRSGSTSFNVPTFSLPGGPGADPDAPTKKGLLLQSDVPEWTCRITNMGEDKVKCLVSVAFRVQRKLTVTHIPLDRFTHIFQGGLRWLTPTLTSNRGELVVSLQPEASETLGIPSRRIALDGVEITEADATIAPVKFDVISARQMLKEAFEDLATHFSSAPYFVPIPDDFVDRMVEEGLRGGGRDLVELATELLPRTDPVNNRPLHVKAAFADLDIMAALFRPAGGSVADDLALRITFTITDLHAAGSAFIGSAEASIDSIEARLYLVLGTQRFLEPHPMDDEPRHHGEYMPRTHATWTSRFVMDVGDLDVDTELGGGIFGEVLEQMIDVVANHFDYMFSDAFEDAAHNAVRGYLAEHKKTLAAEAGKIVMQIANRDHALHDFRVNRTHLLIEHFDPLDVRRRPAMPTKRQPLHTPIDGPMDPMADARLAMIDHIVVVMMENRSFDHMLGYLSHPNDEFRNGSRRRIDIDGLTGDEQIPHGGNVTGTPLVPMAKVQHEFRPDPNHGFASVALQIGAGAMDGFVPAFRKQLAKAPEIDKNGIFNDESRILGFLTAAQTEINHYMATEFCVLDRWFCSFPGGTYPNRLCQLAGMTTELTNRALFPNLGYLEPTTLFQLLRLAHVEWRQYEGDISFLRSFKAHRVDFERIRPIDDFFKSGGERLAPVTFIDPNMTGVPSEHHAEDDHPPTSVDWGQDFLRRVLMRLIDSPGWDNSLLIVTYDEHGGFYDHVAPPGTPVFHARHPDVSTELSRVHPNATMLGVRVPTFAVSPRVGRGTVGHKIYDHASIIRTVMQRFAPDRIPLMPERVRQARHLGDVLRDEPRNTLPPPELPQRPNPFRLRSSRTGSGLMLEMAEEDADDARALLRRFGAPVGLA